MKYSVVEVFYRELDGIGIGIEKPEPESKKVQFFDDIEDAKEYIKDKLLALDADPDCDVSYLNNADMIRKHTAGTSFTTDVEAMAKLEKLENDNLKGLAHVGGVGTYLFLLLEGEYNDGDQD